MLTNERALSQTGIHTAYPSASTVISSVTDASGLEVVISRYGDDGWELWPYFEQSNISPSAKKIDWRPIPVWQRSEFKAVAYRYWTEGLPGMGRPIARSVVQLVEKLRTFGEYLAMVGVARFAEVHPIHLSGFIHHRTTVDKVKPSTLARNLIGVEMLHRFRSEAGLAFEPWPGSSAVAEAGWTKGGRIHGTTPLIPADTLQVLFVAAERLLVDADRLLEERDHGDRITGYDAGLNLLRDACFFLIGLLTGMRCEEIVGIEVKAARSETRQGVILHWVRSIEHKTKKGRVEYLMPAMGHRVLAVMERWSEPLRAELKAAIEQPASGPQALRRRAEAVADVNRLFLGRSGAGRQVRALAGMACGQRMQKFANHARVDWPLRPHQLRRAYAWTFARHRLGDLLFLKEQFKHSSISMTQLYAANPMQDEALYEDLFDEITNQKIDVIEGWLSSGQPLAGRAGERIVKMRAHDFPDRSAMICETAEMVSIRSTGHAWCLAQDEGCGGAGLYEPTRCAGCADAVIDCTQHPVWQELHTHQMELLTEAKALGPATVQRVTRDIKRTESVLTALGWQASPEGRHDQR
jgi:site-specific recombinase XerD